MIGRTLAHYRIESTLGAGGMGVVYKAHDTHLHRPVAIKVLRPDAVANPERKRRFVQEAKIASALNHPNIITIYDIDTADGTDFIAMEYLAGQTLDRLIGCQRLPLREALHYAIQIADALAKAHAAGIVHRDLKPQNVMVGEERLVKVLDFGLAKLTEPEENDEFAATLTAGPRTKEGAIVGTVAYMSPEQAEGKKVDARSDIFSFGVVLYEMLTGQQPFQGDSHLAILSAILKEEPSPVIEIAGSMPTELETIVSRCLRKDRDRRFQHAADLRVALEEVSEALRPASVAAAPGAQTGKRLARRRRLLAVAAVAAAGALIVILSPSLRQTAWDRLGLPRLPAGNELAVLPFHCDGDDAAGRAFCDGLGETIVRKLRQLEQFHPEIRVAPGNHLRQYGVRSAADARLVLGSRLALAGAVRRTGDRVELLATLVDTETQRELRRQAVDASMGDLAMWQVEVIGRIAGMLGVKLSSQERGILAGGGATVPQAWDQYVRGQGHLQRAAQEADLNRAIELFGQAVEREPSFALAHAARGEAYLEKSTRTKQVRYREIAEQSCLRAIALEPRLVLAHVALGEVHSEAGRWKEAIEQFRRALDIDPAWMTGYLRLPAAYDALGRLEEAESTLRRLIQARPNYTVPYLHLSAFYIRRARYAEAEPVLRKAVELAPNLGAGYMNLGAVYHYLGRFDEAAAMMKKSLTLLPTATGYSNLGTLYFFQGRYADAVPLMEKAVEIEGSSALLWGNLADAFRWTPERASDAAPAYRRAIQLAEQSLAANPNDATVRSRLAVYYAKLPDRGRSLAQIALARRLAPTHADVLFKSALVYELAGERNRAVTALELAVQSGYSLAEVEREPELAKLREDPRYGQITAGRSGQR